MAARIDKYGHVIAMYDEDFDEEACDEIIPNLYISGFYPSKDLERLENLGMTHIVNLSSYDNEFPTTFKYHRIVVDDLPDQEIYSHLDDAMTFIEEALKSGGKVLVHCNAGQSRAGSIVAAYLMKSRDFSLDDALKFARSKRKRNKVLPNSGFMKQLREYEKKLKTSSGQQIPDKQQ